MHRSRLGRVALLMLLAVMLNGCQNTLTRIELPDLNSVSWRYFFTGFTYSTGNLEVSAVGSYIDADMAVQGGPFQLCGDPVTGEHVLVDPPGACAGGYNDYGVAYQYIVTFELQGPFTSGQLVFTDPDLPAVVRTVDVVTGNGSRITLHYVAGEGDIPLPHVIDGDEAPDDGYLADNFTFFGMGPADPRFRSNVPFGGAEWEEAILNGHLCLAGADGPDDDLDFIVFDIKNGSGSVSCELAAPRPVPSLNAWLQVLMALLLLALGAWAMRRKSR